jgi:hypothetical protein
MKAGQEEMRADINDEAKDRQDKADAEATTRQEQLNEYTKRHMKACLEELRSCGKRTTACQVSSVVCPEKSKAGPEGREAAVDTFEGSLNNIEITDVEAILEDIEVSVERLELLNNEINFDNIGSLEDRYGDRCLVVRRRRTAKKRTQDSVGSRQKLSAARKRLLIRRAVSALRKGNICKGPGRGNVGRGNSKVRIFGKKQRTRSKYNKGIKDRGAKEQTRQRMRRTFDRTTRKTVRLEIDRRIVRSAVELKQMNNSAIWKIRPPLKRKKSLSPA